MQTNTNTKRKRLNKKLFIILISLALVMACAYFAYASTRNKPSVDQKSSDSSQQPQPATVNTGPATSTQVDAGQGAKDETVNNPEDTVSPTLSANIISSQITDGVFRTRIKIDSVTTGTCEITLSKSGQSSIKKVVNIQPAASISSCQGFDIPVVEFPSSGNWSYTIIIKTSNSSTQIQSNIEITK